MLYFFATAILGLIFVRMFMPVFLFIGVILWQLKYIIFVLVALFVAWFIWASFTPGMNS